jgi:very-short-patch-repair endonuclease
MRAELNLLEQLLWSRICGRQLGVVFRRQVPLLGRFIVDFLAPARRRIVEVHGGYHVERARADARRDAVLTRAGYRVLRVEAALVLRDLPAVIERVGSLLGISRIT